MCRFLVYRGSDEILLSKLVLDPTHSILKQSYDCRLRLDTRRGINNADGFGIGFYTDPKLGSAPCLFTSTTPAWNCTNLERIASKTASRLIFAHVRATTEGSLSEDNCHPFTCGSLMWMHNGGLGGWKYIKRRLAERLADKWYLFVTGGTDSEWSFALFLDTLERMGYDPENMPENGFGPMVLRKAVLKTIAIINELTEAIPESIIHAEGVDTRSLLNFAVADSHSVICTRYISSATDEAASLYYSSGTRWETKTRAPSDRDYMMSRQDKGAGIVLVASEPLTFERENWVNVPTNSILTIHKQTVMVHPIVDQYYSRSPYHIRSSAYVQAQGLTSNEKRRTPAETPEPEQSENAEPCVAAPSAARHPTQSLAMRPPPVLHIGPTIPMGLNRASEPSTVAAPRASTQLHYVYPPQSQAASSVPQIPLGGTSPVDRRSTTSTPTPSTASTPNTRAAQGNIKVKRRSLGQIEVNGDGGGGVFPVDMMNGIGGAPGGVGNGNGNGTSSGNGNGIINSMISPPMMMPVSPMTPEPRPPELGGNPDKIAQFFPELRRN